LTADVVVVMSVVVLGFFLFRLWVLFVWLQPAMA
jgi:hypothetical protein